MISEDIQSTSEIARTIPAAMGFESARRLADGDPLAPKIPDPDMGDDDDFGTWLDGPSTTDADDPLDPLDELAP
jgi:hypothetical protein